MSKSKDGTMLKRVANAITFTMQQTSILRSELITKMLDPRRDIDAECGYPKTITKEQYNALWEREGAAKRVVEFWPDESWVVNPEIQETEDPEKTDFEEAWEQLAQSENLYFHLHRIDVLSGIGRFGVLLIGLNDGQEDLSQPVPGINPETGEAEGTESPEGRELLFIRAFQEHCVRVATRNTNKQSKRYTQPETYEITFEEESSDGNTLTKRNEIVHWTRVIHIADNRESSEVYGTPRMQVVYNRIYDLRKILSGSGEMFWKGAFPGLAIESDPTVSPEDVDTDTLRKQLADYANGLQRWIALAGMKVKSLDPQMADPEKHSEVQMKAIAFAMGVPWRKFIGSEQAQLASEQDTRTWNGRVMRRNENYVTPLVIRPFIDRLILMGILPPPAEETGYSVVWTDLNVSDEKEKAEVARLRTEAIARYVSSGAAEIMPPAEFFIHILEMDMDKVEQIMEAADEFEQELNEARMEEEERQRQLAAQNPQPGDGLIEEANANG